jgi:DNA-binding transcriptional ArsR family regulator
VTPSAEPRGVRELREIDAVFDALAHPARRDILQVLNARGTMTAGALAERFSCAWPTTTRHLGVLGKAGLVHVEPRGRERHYSVDVETLRSVIDRFLRPFGAP